MNLDEDIIELVKNVIGKYQFDTATFDSFIHSLVVTLETLLNGHTIEDIM